MADTAGEHSSRDAEAPFGERLSVEDGESRRRIDAEEEGDERVFHLVAHRLEQCSHIVDSESLVA